MSKQGGDINDFAKNGTSIPGDAGKMNTIPSVPNPQQKAGEHSAPELAGAADNATEIPRNPGDGPSNEVLTATGDQLPGSVTQKNLGGSSGGK